MSDLLWFWPDICSQRMGVKKQRITGMPGWGCLIRRGDGPTLKDGMKLPKKYSESRGLECLNSHSVFW